MYTILVYHTTNSGINKAIARRNIISNNGIEIFSLNKKYAIVRSVKGAAIELTTIIPTIVDSFALPIKLTANGAPNAVETPDNNVADRASFG